MHYALHSPPVLLLQSPSSLPHPQNPTPFEKVYILEPHS